MNGSTNDIVLSNLFTFESLVKFPLEAIIESSAKGNTTTIDFLKSYCFKYENGKRVARTFTFYYDYVKGGSAQTMKVEIPVLSLITIPYYTIDSAKFEMGVNVISWMSDQKIPGQNVSSKAKEKDTFLAMLGPYNSTTTKSGTQFDETAQYNKINTNMKMKMEVVSSDLPAGVLQLINVSSQGIEGHISHDLKIDASTSKLIMKKSKSRSLTLVLKNSKTTQDQKHSSNAEESLVPLTISIQSSILGLDPSKAFSDVISVTKGNIVGSSSYEKIEVLTDNDGEATVQFHPSGKISTNGFITISCPLTSNKTIYYRIEKDE